MTREEQTKDLREQLETSHLDAMTPQQAAKILRSANLGGVLRTAAELGAEALERSIGGNDGTTDLLE